MEEEQSQIYLFRRMSELATVSESITQVLQQEDYKRFDILIQQSRKLKAAIRELSKSTQGFVTQNASEEAALQKDLNGFIKSITTAETVIAEHLQKLVNNKSREELLSTPEGCAIFAEILLPASWDLEKGMIGLIGQNATTLAHKLLERGQKRIVVYDPKHDPEKSNYADDILVAQKKIDIPELCSKVCGGPAPMHIASRMPDPKITDQDFDECAELLREGVATHQIMQNTVDRFGRYWLLHGIQNIPYILQHPSLNELQKAIAGKPLIMVAPGPSLDKNINDLKKIAHKAVLCCISQCVGKLIKEGIKPDFVFAADPQNLVSHFDEVKPDNVGALVLAATVNTNLYQVPAERFVTMAANGDSDEWLLEYLGQQPNTSAGGSVACSVFSLGLLAQSNPLILVGQDLAFSNQKLYSKDSAKGDLKIEYTDDGKSWKGEGEVERDINNEIAAEQTEPQFAKVFEIPGYYGGQVQTTEAFRIFWNWFAQSASSCKSGIPILNCTEGGAFIPGMQHIPLKEAAERYLHEDIDKDSLQTKLYEDLAREESIELGIKKIEDTLLALEQCIAISTAAKHVIENYTPEKLEEINTLEQELLVWIKKAQFISIFRPMDVRNALKELAHVETVEESFFASKKLYKLIADCVEEIQKPLSESLEILKKLRTT